jgi:hypothetical protein
MAGEENGAPRRPRYRHDGFTPAKRERFFKALKKYRNIADGCAAAPISRKTFRYHYDRFADFADAVDAILELAAAPLEGRAWRRAIMGAEEKIWRKGELVQVKLKPSDAMLKTLLAGADPVKYAPHGRALAAMAKKLRRQIEKEVRAEAKAQAAKPKQGMELRKEVEAMLSKINRRFGGPD